MQVSALALVTLALLVPLHQAREQAPTPAGTGRIAGTVVGAESGRAVRFADVQLTSGTNEYAAVTDDSGAFSFDRLATGAYTLRVSKPGYLDMAYGQARPGTDTPGKPIVLSERGQSKTVVVPLSQGGSISGVVRDDRGDPAFQASVTVSRWVTVYGVRRLEAVDSTLTDERGRYRLSLLPPRDYILSAAPADDSIPDKKEDPHAFGFARRFFPAAATAQTAEALRLGLGEERTNADLLLPLVPLGRVTGTVFDANGRPAPGVMVALNSRESTTGDDENHARTNDEGQFTFERVAPGPYTVTASTLVEFPTIGMSVHLPRSFRLGRSEILVEAEQDSRPTTQPPGTASSDVSVIGGTAARVPLTLEPPRVVSGRIIAQGPSDPPTWKEVRIELSSITGLFGPPRVNVNDDGTFELTGVAPGRYAIGLGIDIGAPWNLASATSGGVDVLDAFLEVQRDRDVRDVTITLRDRASELTGAVTDATGRPVGERTVIVFPADERLWAGSLRVQAHHLAGDGVFAFSGLRQGRYLLGVVDGVEDGEWLDPGFLRQLVTGAVAVTLGDGERKVQDLRVR